jgi:uncharacterized membrane-anchored protein
MSRKTLIIIAIILQLIVLTSFVVRYEILKQTGTTVYIPLRGYDPTDIFRGDYVNLSYELPYTGSTDNYSYEQQYLIPVITGKTVTGIREIAKMRPESGIYFQIRNGWMQDSTQQYTIKTKDGTVLGYSGSSCLDIEPVGSQILYSLSSYGVIGDIQLIRPGSGLT